jgi:hypothetical protein
VGGFLDFKPKFSLATLSNQNLGVFGGQVIIIFMNQFLGQKIPIFFIFLQNFPTPLIPRVAFYLTPLVPLSLRGYQRRGGNLYKRGWRPSTQATLPGGYI